MINYMQEQEEREKAFAKALTTEEFFTDTADLNPQDYKSSREYKDYQIQKNKLEISDITWKNEARKKFWDYFYYHLDSTKSFYYLPRNAQFFVGKNFRDQYRAIGHNPGHSS